MKRLTLLALSVLTIIALYGCGGSEPPEAPADSGTAPAHADIPPVGKPVVEVPDAVKGRWKGVVLIVEDNTTGKIKEYTAELGEDFNIPDSDLTVEVSEFFPSFVMQGSSITSTSNETDNPAALVSVTEGGSEIFSGWLFANYPTTHAFSHPRFAITLKEGVPR